MTIIYRMIYKSVTITIKNLLDLGIREEENAKRGKHRSQQVERVISYVVSRILRFI